VRLLVLYMKNWPFSFFRGAAMVIRLHRYTGCSWPICTNISHLIANKILGVATSQETHFCLARLCYKDQFTLRDSHLMHRGYEHQLREWVRSLKKVLRQCAAVPSPVTLWHMLQCRLQPNVSDIPERCTAWHQRRSNRTEKNICINYFTLDPSLYFSNYQLSVR